MGISTSDIRQVWKKAQERGVTIISGPEDIEFGPSMVPDEAIGHTSTHTIMKLVDPAGIVFEVTEKQRRDPVSKVSISVTNLDTSIEFYQKVQPHPLCVLHERPNHCFSDHCGSGSRHETLPKMVKCATGGIYDCMGGIRREC
jgi:hypothetical protein